MKSRNFLVLTVLVLALLLAACGPGVQGPLPASQPEAGSTTEAVEPPTSPAEEVGAATPTRRPASAGGDSDFGPLISTMPPSELMGGISTSTPSPNDQLPAYVNTARRWLAGDLAVPAAQVKYLADEPAEWTDSCLGLGKANESCAQVVTPGYKITLEVNGTQYIVRTDETAKVVRLEEQP